MERAMPRLLSADVPPMIALALRECVVDPLSELLSEEIL